MPRIAEETIQRVAEANDIVEVIGSYFPLKRAGTTYKALCPFHREKTPSFSVNAQRQTYKCFGCGAGGDVIRFVREYEHLDFIEAVRKLAQRAGIPIIEEAGDPEEGRRHEIRKRLLALHAEAAAWFHHNLLKTPDAQVAREYLKSRAIGSAIAKSWQLGYAPDSWDALLQFLRGKRFSPDEIAQSGLAASRDENEGRKSRIENLYARFRGRVMFPIRNDYGEVIAFSGRVLDPEAKTAKYVNSPETPLFTKGRVLYGLDKSKRALIDAKTAIVCEGQLDLISAFESGVQNVIAPQGTAFTTEQARVLQRFVETVVLCFDSDRAGQEAVSRSLPALLEHGLDVRVARLPQGEDPDSLIRGQGPEAFRTVVNSAKNFFEYAIDVLSEKGTLKDPAGKTAAAKRLGPYVAHIKDKVLREATTKTLCTRLGISGQAFASHVKLPPARKEESESSPAERRIEALPMDHTVSHLCRLALMHPDVREWMKLQGRLEEGPETQGIGLLDKIIDSSLQLELPAARAAFTAGLNAAEEAAVASLDLDRSPPDPLKTAQDLWNGLANRTITRQIDETKARQDDPSLDASEVSALQMTVMQTRLRAAEAQLEHAAENLTLSQIEGLQTVVENLRKQILDLQTRLHDG